MTNIGVNLHERLQLTDIHSISPFPIPIRGVSHKGVVPELSPGVLGQGWVVWVLAVGMERGLGSRTGAVAITECACQAWGTYDRIRDVQGAVL